MRIDFHTHSIHSPDGGLTEAQYLKLLDNSELDYIAITDHNTIDFAKEMHKKHGDKIIIGEEVMTEQGEIIALFIDHLIPQGLTARKTAEMIHQRGGLVYIPHPFETVRSGLNETVITEIEEFISIVEVVNGRTVQSTTQRAQHWIQARPHIVAAAGSDAHSFSGAGLTFTEISTDKKLTKSNCIDLLQYAQFTYKRPPLSAYTAPKLNRFKKLFR